MPKGWRGKNVRRLVGSAARSGCWPPIRRSPPGGAFSASRPQRPPRARVGALCKAADMAWWAPWGGGPPLGAGAGGGGVGPARPPAPAPPRRCLGLLSGRRHRVIGAVALATPGPAASGRAAGPAAEPAAEPARIAVRVVQSTVTFKRLHPDEIDRYIESGEWRDKAGGYAIQGRAAIFVRRLSGSYSNVVGLPLFETWSLLEGAG
ncbi:MAG: Maf-like protein [Rhodospirillaceae bacterium]|nr:Maf-like protein [Rhodospirillaceae bacterium]